MTEEIRVLFDNEEASGDSGDFAYQIIEDGLVREVDGKLRVEIERICRNSLNEDGPSWTATNI